MLNTPAKLTRSHVKCPELQIDLFSFLNNTLNKKHSTGQNEDITCTQDPDESDNGNVSKYKIDTLEKTPKSVYIIWLMCYISVKLWWATEWLITFSNTTSEDFTAAALNTPRDINGMLRFKSYVGTFCIISCLVFCSNFYCILFYSSFLTFIQATNTQICNSHARSCVTFIQHYIK